MSIQEVWTFFFTYLFPIVFFIYTAADVMLRNAKKTEHRLLCLTACVYILLFIAEYVRHQLPISYSPVISALWFSNVGIIMPGLGFHFLAKFSGMDKRMPRYLYPAVFYLPLLVIPINVLSSKEIISSSVFIQEGVWKHPVYNTEYYIALSVSILVSSLYLVVLYMGKAKASTQEHKAIFNLLILAVIICTCWHVVFGYVQFTKLPPYPYIYGGVIWCFILRLAMIKYDFLNFVTKRYEKLFNLNPSAILLVDCTGHIKEANPSARQLFDHIDLERMPFYEMVDDKIIDSIRENREIKDYETSIVNGDQQLDVLIDGDSTSIDNEPHMIVIVRDITVQKANQEEIRFLAYHDPLTRLPNRRYFYEQLSKAIHEAEQNCLQLMVIVIDLDFFKETNDKYGHEAGDEVLRHTAWILNEIAGTDGLAARLGGDEFVLFIRNISSRASALKIIQQVQKRFDGDKLLYREQHISVNMSIGVSVYPEDGRDRDSLLMSADKAMYQNKHSGKYEYDL